MSVPDIFPKQISKEHIKFIRRKEWDIFFSCKHRYPYVVVENLHPTILKQEVHIDRQSVEDPFRYDPKLSTACQLTLPVYDNLKRYGLSPGHNAPAGTHMSSPEVWSETFYFSNVTPQEITFNAGVWVILENWVKRLIRNPRLTRLRCITGSPPSISGNQGSRSVWDPATKRNTSVKVPKYMFKIILAEDRRKIIANNGIIVDSAPLYVACFLYPNKPIIPSAKTWDIKKYRVMIKDIEDVTGFNIHELIKRYYKVNPIDRLESLETIASIDFYPSEGLKIQMERAMYYSRLAYAKSRRVLDRVWAELMKNHVRLQITDLSHHEKYRDARLGVLEASQKYSKSNKSSIFLDNTSNKSHAKSVAKSGAKTSKKIVNGPASKTKRTKKVKVIKVK